MNVYNYINLELTDRGWHRDGSSVFHKHEIGNKYRLEILNDGTINVIDSASWTEVDLIPAGEYDMVNKYNI